MPWFRWLKKKTDDEPAEQVVEDTAQAEETSETEADAIAPLVGADGQTKKRRRGSRGGRNRKRSTPAEDEAASGEPEGRDAPPPEPGSSIEKTTRPGSRRRTASQPRERRRQPPRRAPLPSAKREVVISVDVGEQRVAILEDGRVAEVYLERPERRSIAGNIYVGTVDNVLPGMEAAFVEIGLEKNGFLYVDEIVVPELEGKRHGKKITDLIQRGQQILVQAVKDPMKTKGARLTTEISLPGRFLVFVPNGEGLGVSRRLDDVERQRLKEVLKRIAPAEGGVIVRTAAEGASAEDIERDLVFLQRLWKTIQARANAASGPSLAYQEAELPLRIVRDLFAGDFEAAYVDNDRAYKRIVGYLKKTSPHMVDRVHRDKEREPLFERYGIEREIASTLARRVELPSGGSLIFDYAEAFTVIDVNTGRFVGSRSKTSTQRLEDTIVKNNLEAVKEVVRQLRLRDIGGIIVIDFIDMANPKNRQAVEEALRTELERDRTKTYVVEISPLGLVEMTRQNVTDGPREIMTRKCPVCAGDGIVVSDATHAMHVERGLRSLAASSAGSRVQAYQVAVHPRVLALLAGPGGERLSALDEATRRRFFLVAAVGHVHLDHLEVLAEGRLADLQPTAPVNEDAELEVKLVEVGLHDAGAGVGKIDGIDVVVAGAAKLVGKKALVRIGRVLDGQAFASLVVGEQLAGPITFESEAEKPTRAPSKRKLIEDEPDTIDSSEAQATADVTFLVDDETTSPADDETTSPADDEAILDELQDDSRPSDEAATPPKKRTRRGSRGGKRRKKPVTDPSAVSADDLVGLAETPDMAIAASPLKESESRSPDAPAAVHPRRTPRIHVPEALPAQGDPSPVEPTGPAVAVLETGVDGVPADGAAPARKRTRRGTRGGRNRRQKVAVATNGDAVVEDGSAGGLSSGHGTGEPEAAGEEARSRDTEATRDGEADGYVPMAEWIGDFEQSKRSS